MEGTTLERLQVVIEASARPYQADLERVRQQTSRALEEVDRRTSGIGRLIGRVTGQTARQLDSLTSRARRQQEAITRQAETVRALQERLDGLAQAQVDRLTPKYERQTEAVQRQQNAVERLQRQLAAYTSGEATPSSVRALERDLAAAERELSRVDAQMQPLLEQLTQLTELEEMGTPAHGLEELRRQIDDLNPAYDQAEERADSLRRRLEAVRMAPQSTEEAQRLQAELETATQRLERLRSEAETTAQRMQDIRMNPEGSEGLGNRLELERFRMERLQEEATQTNRQIEEVLNNRHTGTERGIRRSRSEAHKSNSTFDKLGKTVDRVSRRIKRLISAVFVYNLIRGALRGMQETLSAYLQTNERFKTALSQVKSNLLVAFAPIYNAILPALNSLMEWLAKATQYVASFVSALFGGTYDSSYQAAQGLESAKNAMDDYGDSAKKAAEANQLLAFDEINKLTDNDSGSNKSDTSSLVPPVLDTSKTDEKALGLLNKIKEAIGPTIEALKRLKEAMRPFKEFTFQAARDFYDRFLVPVASWVLGAGLPRLLDITSSIFREIDWRYLNGVLANFFDALQKIALVTFEALLDFYEHLLKPIAVWTIGEGLPRFLQVLTDITNKIKWDRLLQCLRNVWDAIAPFAIHVGEGLLWFLENVLGPIAAWTIGEVLPVFLDGVATLIGILDQVVQAFKPGAKWLFDNFLYPIAKWTGGVIVDVLKWIVERLKSFSDWARDNKTIMEDVALIIETMFIAWFTYGVTKKIASVIEGITTGLRNFAGGISLAGMQSTIASIGLAAVAGAILLIVQNWGQMNGFERVVSILGVLAAGALVAAIAFGAFQSALTVGIAVAGIVAGISAVVYAVESAKKRAEESTKSLQNMGSGNYNIPQYATGGFPDRGQLFIANEKGPEMIGRMGNRNVVANNDQITSGISNAVYQAIVNAKGDNVSQPIYVNVQVGGREVKDVVVDEINNETRSTGVCPILV